MLKEFRIVASAIFSMEIPKEQLVMRLLSATACISYGRMRTGHLNGADLLKLDGAKESLLRGEIYIDDTAGIDINELLTKVRRLKSDHNVGLIIIDYLQLMRNEAKSVLSQEELSMVSRSLKTLARELNISIIVLSQLHRTLKKQKKSKRRPELSDLRDAGSLENDADVILFVYRETVYCTKCRKRDGSCTRGHENYAEIIIPKQRNGAIGTVCLAYCGDNMNF
ncbi:MAG: DnaB-like helicase C-terminal domain-containing protein, partial [Desulfuromonadaceae bacterium]